MDTQSTVVNCAVYRNGRKLKDISIAEISDVLAEPDTFVWVGLLEPEASCLKQIQEEFNLHELAIEDASNAHQRPKLEEYGETLFVVLHTARLENETIQSGETHVFLGPRFIVTVRHGPSMGYAAVRERAERMPDRLAKGPGYVLYLIIDFVVDHYQPCVGSLQAKFRNLEQQLFQPNPQADQLQQFYTLKNEILKLQEAAEPLTAICQGLVRFHSEIIPKENRVYYRDILDHIARVTQATDRMQEMINAAMQVGLAQVTIRQNEVVKKLAGWGAILAVPTMVFSLYGMNFEHMPELQWKWSYPLILCGIGVGCFLLHRRLRRAGWL
jgi:magnesium transporter